MSLKYTYTSHILRILRHEMDTIRWRHLAVWIREGGENQIKYIGLYMIVITHQTHCCHNVMNVKGSYKKRERNWSNIFLFWTQLSLSIFLGYS